MTTETTETAHPMQTWTLWEDTSDSPPSTDRVIAYFTPSVGGSKYGRIEDPTMDAEGLRERLGLDRGEHIVALDWRAAVGRGSVGRTTLKLPALPALPVAHTSVTDVNLSIAERQAERDAAIDSRVFQSLDQGMVLVREMANQGAKHNETIALMFAKAAEAQHKSMEAQFAANRLFMERDAAHRDAMYQRDLEHREELERLRMQYQIDLEGVRAEAAETAVATMPALPSGLQDMIGQKVMQAWSNGGPEGIKELVEQYAPMLGMDPSGGVKAQIMNRLIDAVEAAVNPNAFEAGDP